MPDPNLREQLLSIEKQTPHLRDQYEKELKAMIERELNWKFRAGLTGTMIVTAIGAVICVATLLMASGLPALAKAGLAGGAVANVVWVVMASRILKRGTFNVRHDNSRMVGLIWVFMVFMMTIFLYLGMETDKVEQGIRMILYGFVFLFMAGVFMIKNFVGQFELNMKENLLRIELKIAELQESAKPAAEK